MKLILVLSTLIVSTSLFSASTVSRERSSEAAQKAAISFAKTSHSLIGDKLRGVELSILDTDEVSRSRSSDNLTDISKIKVEVGFDSGHGVKYSELYEVESNSVGFVTSIKFLEQ